MSETKVPALPSPTDGNLLQVARALKQMLDVREGLTGNVLDANVTFRDLVDSGLANVRPGVSNFKGPMPVIPPWVENDGYDPTTDFTSPSKPVLTATGLFATVQLQWDAPNYRNHSYTEVWRSDANVLGGAVLIGSSDTNFYVDNLGTSATRYYWVRFVSKAGVRGPYNDTEGAVVSTATDPGLVLESLSGQITESQLASALATRINLIDASSSTSGSVNARIAAESASLSASISAESAARAAAITAEAAARSAAIQNEADARATAILNEASTRAASVGALQTQINTLQAASSGDFAELLSAVQSEQTARIAADQAEATSRETLATQLRGSYLGTDPSMLTTGILYNERQTRITAEGALSSSISALSATVSSNQSSITAALTTEQQTRASADNALSSSLTTLSSTVNNPTTGLSATRATLINDYYTKTATDSAISSAITTLSTSVAGTYATNANLTTNYYTKSATDSAIASANTTLSTQFNNTLTGYVTNSTLTNNYYTKSATDSAISAATSSLVSTTTLNTALSSYVTSSTLTANYYTKTQTDSAISSATSTLVSTTTLNNSLANYTTTSALQTNYYTKTQTDSAISTANTTLTSTFDNKLLGYATTAALSTEATTRATADNGLLAQYTVKTDLAGRVAGYGLASESTTAGASTSSFGVVVDKFYLAAPNDYTQETTPTGATAGKIWYKPSTKQTFRYDGSSWVSFNTIFPFVVQTTPTTINGVSVPAGVYIDAAFIKDGTITNAKIGNAAIDNAKIANIDASKITAGTIDAGRIGANSITADKIDSRNLTIKDAAGNVIFSSSGTSYTNVIGLGALATQSTISFASLTGAKPPADATRNVIYRQATQPSGVNGDIWVNTGVTPNVTYIYSSGWEIASNYTTNTNQLIDGAGLGTTAVWTSVSGRPTTLAALDATAASDLDGKTVTYYQNTAPAGTANDLWFDTDDGNKLYRHNGTTWVAVQDAGIAEAAALANSAQTTANSKVTTFYTTSTPTALAVGDLWYDTTNKILKRWNGSSWQDTASKNEVFRQASAPTGASVNDVWFKTDTFAVYYFNGTQWVLAGDRTSNNTAAAIANQGAFATLNKINTGNVSTYIDAGAIGNAYIGNFISSINFDGSINANGSITANGTLGWAIGKAGNAVFNSVTLRGELLGGSYTGYAWPASGTGFYLGPSGLLLGNGNTGKYLAATSTGDFYLPGMNVVNGTLTIDAVNVIKTLNIAGNAVTIPAGANGIYSATTSISVTETTSVSVIATFTQGSPRDGYAWYLSLNGTVLQSDTPRSGTLGAMSKLVSVSAGTHTFSMYTDNPSGTAFCGITVLAVKR